MFTRSISLGIIKPWIAILFKIKSQPLMEIKLYIIVSIASRCRFKKYPAAVEIRVLTAVFFGLKFQNLGAAVLQTSIYSVY